MVDRIVERFRALADAARIRILLQLKEGESSVSELVEHTGLAQPSVSKHLAQLKAAGLVAARRDGNRSYYGIRDPAIFAICQTMCRGISEQAEADWRAVQG
jgi:DNA-binding transcriptional ArsR family regulator